MVTPFNLDKESTVNDTLLRLTVWSNSTLVEYTEHRLELRVFLGPGKFVSSGGGGGVGKGGRMSCLS